MTRYRIQMRVDDTKPLLREDRHMSHRIQLRDCTLYFKDGLAGTGAVNEPTNAPVADADSFAIGSVALNTVDTDLVPIGARFTVAGETDATQVHVVTERTPADAGPTTEITFSPALGAGTYAKTAALAFQAQELEVKLGDGEAKWSKAREMKYDLDRDRLDSVRQGKDIPMDLDINATWEHVRTGTGEQITPTDALDRVGGASEWVSSSADLCEPYAVDVVIVHAPECAGAQKETYLFPDFRYEKEAFDIKNASIQTNGKCNVVEPTITRG